MGETPPSRHFERGPIPYALKRPYFGTFGDQRLITCELRKRADAHQPKLGALRDWVAKLEAEQRASKIHD
jgi:hypothetical protein